MDQPSLNHLAILAAALSNFLVGGLWYSPLLFAKPWMKANHFTEENLKGGNPAMIFGLAFVFSVIIAYSLGFFLNGIATWQETTLYGFLAGFTWATMGLAIIALFERRKPAYIIINGGYLTVAFTLMGLIIGAWR
jgi:hypothetical protein